MIHKDLIIMWETLNKYKNDLCLTEKLKMF